jgi:hypothetical protein
MAAIDPALDGQPLKARPGEFIDHTLVQDIDAFRTASQDAAGAMRQLAGELGERGDDAAKKEAAQ